MDGSKANVIEEKIISGKSGMLVLIVSILVFLASTALVIFAGIALEAGNIVSGTVWMVVGCILLVLSCLAWNGLKIVRPNEAMVLTLFGNYYGTLKTDGFYFVNPFVTSINPAAHGMADPMELTASGMPEQHKRKATALPSKTISLKAITLNNGKQKINDELGNPI
ncbi:MAG: SPFH domain-containing protein, partial [Actinobacteria bacterium]|nr:SPFH domain-containing protein [Actinomycetota bacterium]